MDKKVFKHWPQDHLRHRRGTSTWSRGHTKTRRNHPEEV
jgi:hypothetical protein